MAAALEAFCLLRSAEMQKVVRQKEESPEGHFSINQRGPLMHQHRQRSLLPAERQGQESDETAAKYPVLVRINALYHVVSVYISDASFAMRTEAEGRAKGVCCVSGLRIR